MQESLRHDSADQKQCRMLASESVVMSTVPTQMASSAEKMRTQTDEDIAQRGVQVNIEEASKAIDDIAISLIKLMNRR